MEEQTNYKSEPQYWAANVRTYLLLIILAAVLAYSDSFSGPFIFDDIPSIPDNHSIRNIFSLKDIFHPPKNIAGRPVINFTLAINYAVSGKKVWSYHALNLLIHICASLTLFGIVRRTLLSEKLYGKYGSVSSELALGCALIWMLHPLQTQAVTYIIQRCESLMGMLVLLTLYCAVRGWESHTSCYWHSAAVIACMIGTGTKEAIVIAPFLVFVYDIVFVHNHVKDALRDSKWFYLGLFFSLIMLVLLIMLSGTAASDRENLPFTWFEYIMTQTKVIFHYLRLAILPYDLSLDYTWSVSEPKDAIPHALGILLMIICAFRMILMRSPWGFPAFWFFATLAPTSSIIPIRDIIFEHRMYLPLAGLAVLFVMGGYEAMKYFFKYFINAESRNKYILQGIGWYILIFITLLLGILTFFRNLDYQSEISIWEDTVHKQPQNSRAHNNLGLALKGNGKVNEAIEHYAEALRLKPNDAQAHNNMGLALIDQGKITDGIWYLYEAIGLNPAYAVAHNNLGFILINNGKITEGIKHLSDAIRLDPNYADAYYNMAIVLMDQGKTDEAIQYYCESLRLSPDDILTLNNLGVALFQKGKIKEAIVYFQKALKIKPDYTDAKNNLKKILTKIENNNQ